MKVLFMGTPEFAVESLEKIVDGGWEVAGVVTQPDRPKGRGKKIQPPPVKVKAAELGIQVYQPVALRNKAVLDNIKRMNPDIVVVVAYGQILPEDILDFPPMGCINVHASLLPKYRGAAPINWAIINGDKTTGITTMYMDKGLDTGDIIFQEETRIGDRETAGELHDRLAVLGGEVLVKTLRAVETGVAPRLPQDNSKASYAPQLDRDLGEIHWDNDGESIVNLIRGTSPWPGCFTCYRGRRMKIWKAGILNRDSRERPGTIIHAGRDGIQVQTGKGLLVIEEIQMPSSRRMTVDEYLRGNTMNNGETLGDSCEIRGRKID